ncbi:hypothetical protein AVEN_169139-1, partial [Araneus ventricosus]
TPAGFLEGPDDQFFLPCSKVYLGLDDGLPGVFESDHQLSEAGSFSHFDYSFLLSCVPPHFGRAECILLQDSSTHKLQVYAFQLDHR